MNLDGIVITIGIIAVAAQPLFCMSGIIVFLIMAESSKNISEDLTNNGTGEKPEKVVSLLY